MSDRCGPGSGQVVVSSSCRGVVRGGASLAFPGGPAITLTGPRHHGAQVPVGGQVRRRWERLQSIWPRTCVAVLRSLPAPLKRSIVLQQLRSGRIDRERLRKTSPKFVTERPNRCYFPPRWLAATRSGLELGTGRHPHAGWQLREAVWNSARVGIRSRAAQRTRGFRANSASRPRDDLCSWAHPSVALRPRMQDCSSSSFPLICDVGPLGGSGGARRWPTLHEPV